MKFKQQNTIWIMTLLLISALVLSLGTVTYAASTLKMGTGGETGNYYSMGNDIQSYCGEVLTEDTDFQVLISGASVANIQGMGDKSYSAGIVQEDVLQYFAKQNPKGVNINRMKIIAGLHQEVVYLLIPKNFKPKKSSSLWGDMMSKFKPEANVPLSLDILDGQNIAASGGANVSGKALKYFTGVNFNLVDTSGKAAGNMPIMMVGGQPYKPVLDLLNTGRYVLVSLDADAIKMRAPFYEKVTVNYNVGGKNYSATTVGVRALLLGKAFRKASRNENMIRLSQCISENLADLADDPDTNPNWQSVYELEDEGEQTNWSYFPLEE